MSYLAQIESPDGARLADAACETLKEFLPTVLTVREEDWNSEDFLANLREDFVNKMKEIENEEEKVSFSEERIARSVILRGADGFLALAMERILSKEEKIELLAKSALKHLQGILSGEIAESEQKIIIGLLKNSISEEIVVIQRQKSIKELDRIASKN